MENNNQETKPGCDWNPFPESMLDIENGEFSLVQFKIEQRGEKYFSINMNDGTENEIWKDSDMFGDNGDINPFK